MTNAGKRCTISMTIIPGDIIRSEPLVSILFVNKLENKNVK